jgi:hypothetical protein
MLILIPVHFMKIFWDAAREKLHSLFDQEVQNMIAAALLAQPEANCCV